jgi:hypothetical protein
MNRLIAYFRQGLLTHQYCKGMLEQRLVFRRDPNHLGIGLYAGGLDDLVEHPLPSLRTVQ